MENNLNLNIAGIYGEDLLRSIRRRPISQEIKVLFQVGAHTFQEKSLLQRIFPKLEKAVLFEPNPILLEKLKIAHGNDDKILILPYAIADRDGDGVFHIANNEGLSSSLLEFGTHKKTFPGVEFEKSIPVKLRRLSTVLQDHLLTPPDLLFLDTQGAEYQILVSIPDELLQHVKLIYVEASLEEVYEGAKLLNDLRHILEKRFLFVGFAPQEPAIPHHGNALFVNRSSLGSINPNLLLYLWKRIFG